MTNDKIQMTKKRTVQDKLISGLNSIRYGLTEPVILRALRLKYAQGYDGICEEEPLVSVYVPTYNRASLLMERAVSSVLKQTYKNFELVIVGDHCTDDTEKLVSKVRDKRVSFFNLPKRGYRYPESAENHWLAGPVVAANKALELVRGKWIARIDDDDTWTEDHLEVLLRFAQEKKKEFVSASYITESQKKRVVINVENEFPRIGGTQTWMYRAYLKHFRYNINCWRKSWNRVNDTDLQDRFFRAGVSMDFLDKVVAYVLPRPGEDKVGLAAYHASEKEKREHFKFTSE
ncbi:MAG: glycosyltransferase family 2 protein [Candidatus Omnitrophota bacterium]